MNNKQKRRWTQWFLIFVLVITGMTPMGGFSSAVYAEDESAATEVKTSDSEATTTDQIPAEQPTSSIVMEPSASEEGSTQQRTESVEPAQTNAVPETTDHTAIVPIAEARLLAPNSNVAVSGVVTFSEPTTGEFTNYYIQDDQAGIVVRAKNQLQVGDRIEVYGPITHYNGLVQIEKDKSGFTGGYLNVTEHNVTLPEPKTMKSSDFVRPSDQSNKGLGEKYEGMRVEVRDIKITKDSKENSWTFYATDANGAEMTIYNRYAPGTLTVGKNYEYVQGVLTFNTKYGLELLPRTAADVVENSLSVVASAASGWIRRNSEVVITSPASGAIVHYTTDGSDPTLSSQIYNTPLVITEDTQLKAVAILNGKSSSVYTYTYQLLPDNNNLRIHDIQGAGHVSIYNGYEVKDIEGIVTSVSTNTFYIQELSGQIDNDDRTSEAIQVYKLKHGMRVGNQVKVSGKVTEYGLPGELTSTQITANSIVKVRDNVDLPAPVKLGKGGRIIPTVIDSDSFAAFNPETDAIDFYESLEGMRVELENPEIVGPYSSQPGLAVVVDNGNYNPLRTPAGGIILTDNRKGQYESDLNPQRLFINKKPNKVVKTGDKLNGNVVGVMAYANGNYKVSPEGNLPDVISGETKQAVTSIEMAQKKLTIATFNVENFSKKDAERAVKIGKIIVNNLKTPDIIGIMEVQDNDGSEDTGTTAADESFQTLIDAIKANNGPTYQYTEISPENNKDGGATGANIRVGFLYQPSRVSLAEGSAKGDATTAVTVKADGSLSLNPGRIAPADTAFDTSRKPLAAEFKFNGERVVVIANHFNSKGGDLKPFGSIQPATRSSEVQRVQKASLVNSFVKELLSKDPKVNVAVLGDFNDFQFSQTLNIVAGNELDNLVNQLPENQRYSYIYDGNSQTLDHILVSKNLTATAAIEMVHVNADFDTADGRVSDHDPLLAQLSFEGKGNGSNPGNGGGNNGSNSGSGNSGGGSTASTPSVTPTTPTKPTSPTTPTTSTVPSGNTGSTNPTNPIVDLKDVGNHWAAAAIEQAISRGIVNGYEDGNFRPNASATRAEFIVMLARTFQLPASNKALTFKDAATIPTWAESFIAQAVDQGIISGYMDETFRSTGKVSRVEMTVMLVRALGLPVQTNAKLSFVDADQVPAWAVPYIAAAYDAKLVKGTEQNRFNPLSKATRAEVMTLLMSASELQQKAQ